jgi:hypothetical protein
LGSHTLKWLVGVVFIATNQNIAVREGCWRWAHRTVRCATGQRPVRHHVILPLGLGAGRPLLMRHRTVRCDTGQSGAPLTNCSDFCRVHCAALFTVRVDRFADNRCPAGTLDSPVNYSGAAPRKPEAEEFEVGWIVRGPAPENRIKNPTRTRNIIRVKTETHTRTRGDP